MELAVFTEPQQGATYTELLAVALAAEASGYAAWFRSDHYLKMGDVSGLPGPTDAWITLAGLARDTSRIRLGTLLSAATFRLPGPLSVTVAQVDQMSGGRVELGLGAGWYEAEHAAYGIPFAGVEERFDRLAEQLEVLTALLDRDRLDAYSFSGEHYRLDGCPGLTRPIQHPRPPIVLGGTGPRRTPELAARYADEFNLPFTSLEVTRRQLGRVDQACAAIGRDPATLRRSVALVVCCGSDEAACTSRAERIGRELSELRQHGAAGTPDQVVERLASYGELGITRVYLQFLDLADLDHLRLVAAEVGPALRG